MDEQCVASTALIWLQQCFLVLHQMKQGKIYSDPWLLFTSYLRRVIFKKNCLATAETKILNGSPGH